MKTNTEKKDLKIKLNNHAEFKKVWAALIELGYHNGCHQITPHTAPYLYTYKDGRILPDWFDVEGADLSSPNSAFGYFTASEHTEVTLDDLKKQVDLQRFWSKAPTEVWAWERYPTGKCVWHCKKENGSNYTKKAPSFESEKSTLWKDSEKQAWADSCKPIFPCELT